MQRIHRTKARYLELTWQCVLWMFGYRINVLVGLFFCIVSSLYNETEATGGRRVKEFWFQFNFGYIIFQPHKTITVQIPLHIHKKPKNSTYLGIFITCSEDGENKNMVKRGIIFLENVCLKRKLRIFLFAKILDILICYLYKALLNIMKFLNIVTFILGRVE